MSTSKIRKIDDTLLPPSFKNEIILSEKLKNNDEFVIRSNIMNLQDANKWVIEFGKLTRTQWNSRHSIPNGKQMICMKKFVCHHSDFMKIDKDRNKRKVSKNASCKAYLVVKVKLTTLQTKRTDPFIKKGLPAIIRISKTHTHSLNSAQSLRFLQDTSQILRDTFIEYFNDGMGALEAKRYHQGVLEGQNASEEDLANGSKNPTLATVTYWYSEWKVVNNFSLFIQKLKEKMDAYEKEGMTILFKEEPLCVVVLTPMMKRAHSLPMSGKLVFTNTTSSNDPGHHAVTFMLTPCAAGAAPLAILITRGQTTFSYASAFSLFRHSFPDAFNGQGYPITFITDNSSAEINAIKQVWPESNHLLCIFHVLQSTWRWLWDNKNGIRQNDRPSLMGRFQDILYASTSIKMDIMYNKCLESSRAYPQWISYVQSYWNFKENWCFSYRCESTHNHYTNKFVEASIRIFKDVILSHVKAYNVVSLVDFSCTVLENIYKTKFREFANFKNCDSFLYFKNSLQKVDNLNQNDVIELNEPLDRQHLFLVRSEKKKDNFYTVDNKIGACNCKADKFGAFCEHQCAVYQYFDVSSETFPRITVEDRYSMMKLAVGEEKCPERSFFKDFLSDETTCNNDSTANFEIEYDNKYEPLFQNWSHGDGVKEENESEDDAFPNIYIDNNDIQRKKIEEIVQIICDNLQNKVIEYHSESDEQKLDMLLKKFAEKIRNIRSVDQLEQFLCSPPRRNKSSPKIRIRSTPLSRRQLRISKGTKMLHSGRHLKPTDKESSLTTNKN